MTASLEERLLDALGGSVLAERLPIAGASFLERRSKDRAAAALSGRVLEGLARLLATQPQVAGFLSHRPELFERIAFSTPETLAARMVELSAGAFRADPRDLESCLDELRILRREETCLAACLDLGRVVTFEALSDFLSVLAESIAERGLALARKSVAPDLPETAFSAIGMGKIAGREFTYHSDLDLIFLYQGGPDEIARVSRIGQRFISYLTTMTGAGTAYAVDTRLRPSGQQGTLVTSYQSFAQYQCKRAQTWEHLALVRARAVAGGVRAAQEILDGVRSEVIGSGIEPWAYLRDLRLRVETERANPLDASIPIKTGRGGLMDVDFLAGGGLLERGADHIPALPSIRAMLRATVQGERVEQLLRDYHFLRILEARCRWVRGRAIEALETERESLDVVAELVEPGLGSEALLAKLERIRERTRAAYDAVISARTIRALEE